jgi:pimeloyl-ACP methyl ester carboxylesterase
VDRRDFLQQQGSAILAVAAASSSGYAGSLNRPGPFQINDSVAIREAMVPVPGGALYCRHTELNGPPILLAHPVTGSAHVFDKQMKLLAACGYRGIAWSRRGHRGSTIVDADAPPTAADIDAVADHFEYESFNLLGSAAGGGLALEYAVSRQERLQSLVVACSVTNIDDQGLATMRANFMPHPFRDMPQTFRELGPEYRATNKEEMQEWLELEKKSRDPRVPLGGGAPPPAVSMAEIASLRIPALWVAGGADLFSPPAMLRYVQSNVRCSEFAAIELAGHSAYWEYPIAFATLICDFLGRRAGSVARPTGRTTP